MLCCVGAGCLFGYCTVIVGVSETDVACVWCCFNFCFLFVCFLFFILCLILINNFVKKKKEKKILHSSIIVWEVVGVASACLAENNAVCVC